MVPSLENLHHRAAALQAVRDFFTQNQYLEIQSRALRESAASDPYIDSFSCQWLNSQTPLYLQSSPEYAHKILLSHYFVPIFEIARVFRNEIHGSLHQREFTLVEWYKPQANYSDLIEETYGLICFLAKRLKKSQFVYKGAEVPIFESYECIRFYEAFERFAGFNPYGMQAEALIREADKIGTRLNPQWSINDMLNCILIDKIEPRLGFERPCFLIDYPESMASLAKIKEKSACLVAERFELYVAGVELCNGYSELTDPAEQRKRFVEDNREREALGFPTIPIDEELIRALNKIPKLAGNALGFDRLLLLLLGLNNLNELLIDF